ncbi:MAG: CooT family nickel-binding protein [Proteobacteria bacterium]|nr:CooT family nickel-binding protein [Pseudomonadota bacterium]
MCESNVFIKSEEKEVLFYKEAVKIIPVGEDEFVIEGLLGEPQKISGKIKEINLIGHKIVFEKK